MYRINSNPEMISRAHPAARRMSVKQLESPHLLQTRTILDTPSSLTLSLQLTPDMLPDQKTRNALEVMSTRTVLAFKYNIGVCS